MSQGLFDSTAVEVSNDVNEESLDTNEMNDINNSNIINNSNNNDNVNICHSNVDTVNQPCEVIDTTTAPTTTIPTTTIQTPTTTTTKSNEIIKITVTPVQYNCLPLFCTRSYKINGIVTHIWIQDYVNRMFVGISQCLSSQPQQQEQQQQEQQQQETGKTTTTTTSSIPSSSKLVGSIGNILLCQSDRNGGSGIIIHNNNVRESNLGGANSHVSHLLGPSRNDPVVTLYARRLWQALIVESSHPLSYQRSLILGITLHPSFSSHSTPINNTNTTSAQLFHTVVNLVVQLYKEHQN